ncbi:MAG: ABC transporter permease [bacterium]|nr:ABC transporter permease [Candidatus Sumerlaeota bacterium]
MKFEKFIARRYLFSGQHKALVSIITVISVLGVAVGVFALIVVLAVMEGFGQNLREKVIGAYSHLEIAPASPQSPPIDSTSTLALLRAMPEVKAAGVVIMRQALVLATGSGSANRQTGMFIQGVDLDEEPRLTRIMDKVTGEARPGPNEIVMGKKAAQSLLLPIGAKLRIMSPTIIATATGPTVVMRNAELAGVFETGFPETDQMIAYTSLDTARELFLVPEGAIDGIRLVLRDPDKVYEVRKKIQSELGQDVIVSTWQERNPILFDALVLEKWVMFIILLLIVMVAAFNIIGTLIMVVMEKTREIGIMKSMGATREAIQRIFLYQGMMIGGAGTLIGAALGLFVCYMLKYYIKIDIMSEAYLSDRIPLQISMWTNVLIVISSLLICLGASFYPARQAAKLDPVEALRYE